MEEAVEVEEVVGYWIGSVKKTTLCPLLLLPLPLLPLPRGCLHGFNLLLLPLLLPLLPLLLQHILQHNLYHQWVADLHAFHTFILRTLTLG